MMKRKNGARLMILAVLVGAMASVSQAGVITATSVTGSGSYSNSVNLIIDGTIASEWSGWTQGTNVYWNGLTPAFVIDLGETYLVEDVIISVDNNDSYKVDYSTDNISWSNLFTISSSYGEVSYGMDTMSTFSGTSEYISQIDFSTVSARWLKVYATGGDGCYSVSELEAYGTTLSTVPVPGAAMLVLAGLASSSRIWQRRRTS